MKVRVRNVWSKPRLVYGGVPQGPILGVFLYNVSTDDLENEAAPGAAGSDVEEDVGNLSDSNSEGLPPSLRSTVTSTPVGHGGPSVDVDESPVRGRPSSGRPYLPVGSNLARRARAASRRIVYSSEDEIKPPAESSKKNSK